MAEAPVRQRQRRLEIEAPEATVEVYRTVYGVEVEQASKVNVTHFSEPPAFVEVEGSRTVNLGDYNSARVAVRVRLPCYAEESEVRRAYNVASEMVERFMDNELALAVPQTQGGRNG